MAVSRLPRSIWTALLVLLVVSLASGVCTVYAQRVVAADSEDGAVVSGEMLERAGAILRTKTVKITRARVTATIETMRIAGKGVHGQDSLISTAAAGNIEQCGAPGGAEGQCMQDPADAMPVDTTAADSSLQEEEQADDHYHRSSTRSMPVPQSEALNMMARHLKELQDQVLVWLPQLQASVARVIDQISNGWHSLVAKWNALCMQIQTVYDHFFADAIAVLGPFYSRASQVTSDVVSVVRSWVQVAVDHAREIWTTHEEVRVVVRHTVSVLLLGCFAALFFSVYALAGTIPDTISAFWTSLDDLTRAQLKIVAVLVSVFCIYHLRELWSFWLLVASIAAFYYWSGHVLAKPPVPPIGTIQRQPSRVEETPASSSSSKLTIH